jgi:hypothetical protein
MDTTDDSDKGFFKHVFNFDDDSKSEILNMLQYILIAIIPVVILNKTIGKYVPEADNKKGSVEIVAEILIQTIFTFLGLLLIHRIITYVPTYSNTKYPEFHIIYVVLAILMITMSLQTKIGEKVSILVDRIKELWNGKDDSKNKKQNGNGNGNGNGNVKVTQPISGQITGQPNYTEGTAISSLPNYEQQAPTQQLPNYDAMYRQDTNPLIGAATPGEVGGYTEPMAANEGYGAFSSW